MIQPVCSLCHCYHCIYCCTLLSHNGPSLVTTLVLHVDDTAVIAVLGV